MSALAVAQVPVVDDAVAQLTRALERSQARLLAAQESLSDLQPPRATVREPRRSEIEADVAEIVVHRAIRRHEALAVCPSCPQPHTDALVARVLDGLLFWLDDADMDGMDFEAEELAAADAIGDAHLYLLRRGRAGVPGWETTTLETLRAASAEVARIPDAVTREVYLQQVARRLRMPARFVRQEVLTLGANGRSVLTI